MEANREEKKLTDAGDLCPDCGCKLGAGRDGACPRCGLRPDGDAKGVRAMKAGDVRNPYAAEYDALCAKIRDGGEPESSAEEYVADMKYRADCGDDMAQHFLATRICDGKRDGRRILELLTEASAAGNHLAERSLAEMYAGGAFGTPDPDAATRLYRRSAERGDPFSMVCLGNRFMRGECVKRDARKAIAWYERALEGGCVEALKALANIHSSGEAMPRDFASANKYWRMAAERGDDDSRYALFRTYRNGWGVERNASEALMWCRLAAEDGHPMAQEALAECYEAGYGVGQSRAEALRWYERAVSCGSCRAMLTLSVRYARGLGCEKNFGRAYYLAMSALDRGHYEALWQLSLCFRNGHGVKPDAAKADCYLVRALDMNTAAVWGACDPETAAREFDVRMRWAGDDARRVTRIHFWLQGCGCEDLSRKALERAVELGSAEAMWRLGLCAQHGLLGVARDATRAFELYRQSSALGSLPGRFHLGAAHCEGVGTEPDAQVGGKLVKDAAEHGLADAQYAYSTLLLEGCGVGKDERLAVEYLRKAAEGRNRGAAFRWGVRLMRGELVGQDARRGVEWLEFAGRNGVPAAWRFLGHCFINGEGVAVDYNRAHDCLRRAAEAGDGNACNELSNLTARGLGCPRDEDRAARLLDRAIEMGSLWALCNKGNICRDKGEFDKAVRCYERAAAGGSAAGKYALAVMYRRGEGVDRDVDKAVELAREAVSAGAKDVEGLIPDPSGANLSPAAETATATPKRAGLAASGVVRWLWAGIAVLIVLEILNLVK